jgi:hypothetical protein
LGNDTFLEIFNNSEVTGWFQGLSANGLKAVVSQYISAGSYGIVIEISGTPQTATDIQLTAMVPGSVLKSGASLTVTPNPAAVIRIAQ